MDGLTDKNLTYFVLGNLATCITFLNLVALGRTLWALDIGTGSPKIWGCWGSAPL